MPRPVLALPCASRSMTRTRCPAAASAVARLIAVVVLPTPPFWLATATIRARCMTGTLCERTSAAARLTGYLLQAKNDPPRIRTASMSRDRYCPVFAREGQFLLDPFAFEKQALAARCEERLGETKQPVERRAGASSHDIDRVPRHRLNPTRANCRGGLGDAHRLAEKGAFPRIGLHQLDTGHAEDRQNQSGEAGAAAEIDHATRPLRHKCSKLRRIKDVTPPHIGDGIASDEVDARRPAGQQLGIGLELRQCFT